MDVWERKGEQGAKMAGGWRVSGVSVVVSSCGSDRCKAHFLPVLVLVSDRIDIPCVSQSRVIHGHGTYLDTARTVIPVLMTCQYLSSPRDECSRGFAVVEFRDVGS